MSQCGTNGNGVIESADEESID